MTTHPPAPGADGGLVSQVRRFLAAATDYLRLRVRLASLEGKEAAGHVVKLVAMAAAAVFLLAAGWLGVSAALILWIGEMLNDYFWATVSVTALHFLLAALLLLRVKSASKVKLFPLTTEELKKDQAWAQTQKKPL